LNFVIGIELVAKLRFQAALKSQILSVVRIIDEKSGTDLNKIQQKSVKLFTIQLVQV